MVAGSGLRRPGRRIAGPPIDEIELGIVRAGDPARSSADLPGVGVLRPSLVPLLAARRNGIAPPNLLSGLCLIGHYMGIERGAEYLAVIDRGALIGDAATHDPRGLRRPLESLLPDLLSGSAVDCA